MKQGLLICQLILSIIVFFSCNLKEDLQKSEDLKLWYQSPAQRWGEAFPIGNGRMAAMCYGGTKTGRFQINEESLWAGCQINPVAENFYGNLREIQKMVFTGEYSKAHDFGIQKLTSRPTSFRSYEPFADLIINFDNNKPVQNYRRELNMSAGISEVKYISGSTNILQEAFISAIDDVLCIRLSASGKEKLNCTIGLHRFKDASIVALPEGKINLDGQIVDVEAPAAYDDNPGGSGPGGKHMRFSGRLVVKNEKGQIISKGDSLVIKEADEALIIFTAVTDYNLSKLNFDRYIDPAEKAENILSEAEQKTWKELKLAHIKEHSTMFNRVTLNLGGSENELLPIDQRLEAFKNGANDNGLIVQLFQFGRYLLMSSSRRPALLPANLQGKWSKEEWAPWEADYHLNVNLQMNYWPADATNLSETTQPLIDWFERIAETGKPFAKELYNANGWFSGFATNPFGRITPSASTPESQFVNAVLDPLGGTWMLMNLWDHFEYTQEKSFLEETLFPLLKGASEFILDVMVPDSEGTLHFVPSTSPENSYIDAKTGRQIRITASSTYHLSIIHAVFKATLEACQILSVKDPICERITQAQKRLPLYPVHADGRLMEWQDDLKEAEPGHRHLSHLLALHPFALITEETPDLLNAAHKSLDWRLENGQGKGGGWPVAHAAIMYTWLQDGEKALERLKILLNSFDGTLLDSRKIFQIDANFGATSCVSEMLVQSHLKDENGNFIIQLLPALPSGWVNGSVKGLCARGNFIIDIDWKDGKMETVWIYSPKGGKCRLRYQGKEKEFSMKAGEQLKWTNF